MSKKNFQNSSRQSSTQNHIDNFLDNIASSIAGGPKAKKPESSPFDASIVPDRLALLRQKSGLSQTRLIEYLRERLIEEGSGKKVPQVNPSIVSAWETGKRNTPDKYVNFLCQLFDVTEAYMRGLTNDPSEETDHANIHPTYLSAMKIDVANLYQYHNKPVYVVFPNYEAESGWAILDYRRRQFVFRGGPRPFNFDGLRSCEVYVSVPKFEDTLHLHRQFPLSHKDIMKAERVYICMKSPDARVRNLYNGWYRHNETRSALINSIGFALPYEGIEISFSAYQQAIEE